MIKEKKETLKSHCKWLMNILKEEKKHTDKKKREEFLLSLLTKSFK